jgi:hypothetical protein
VTLIEGGGDNVGLTVAVTRNIFAENVNRMGV